MNGKIKVQVAASPIYYWAMGFYAVFLVLAIWGMMK